MWSGSTLLASILKLVSNVRQLFAADVFSRRHFPDAFFLGALSVNSPPSMVEKSKGLDQNMRSQICWTLLQNFWSQIWILIVWISESIFGWNGFCKTKSADDKNMKITKPDFYHRNTSYEHARSNLQYRFTYAFHFFTNGNELNTWIAISCQIIPISWNLTDMLIELQSSK